MLFPFQAYAQQEQNSYIIVTPERKENGQYFYRLTGYINSNDYSSAGPVKMRVWADGVGFTDININAYSSVIPAVNGRDAVSINGVLPLDFSTNSSYVEIWQYGYVWGEYEVASNQVDFATARAQLDLQAQNPPQNPPQTPPQTPPQSPPQSPPPSVVLNLDDGCSIAELNSIKKMDQFTSCISSFGGNLNRLLIGIGVLASIFILPWAGVLYASGNPGNIQKANEVLTAWLSGLVLLLLSGSIILLLGGTVFGVA